MRYISLIIAGIFAGIIIGCGDNVTGLEAPNNVVGSETDDNVYARQAGSNSHTPGAVLNFTAPLEGDQEVPAVETRATGLAKFQLDREGAGLSYKLNVANIENVLMAHIHIAPAGENGPVVVWLYPEEGPPPQLIEGRTQGVLAEGTITDDDLVGPLAGQSLDDLIEEIQAGDAYVNVHTQQHPGGEIRGQITHGNGMVQTPAAD